MNEPEIRTLQRKYAKQIGEKLRRLREKAGYTQEQLGWYVAKGYSTISRYENGSAAIPSSDIPIFANRFDKSPSYFFEFEETITEECRNVQKAIQQSYMMLGQLDGASLDIDTQGYMMPSTDISMTGPLSVTAIKRLSDMSVAFYLYQKDYITQDKLMEHIVNIQKFNYSKQSSYFENFDFKNIS